MNLLERVNASFDRKVSYTITFNYETDEIYFDTDISKSEMKLFNIEHFNQLMKERECKYKPVLENGYLRLIL